MKPPVHHRMFGYPLSLLPNARLQELERGVTSIEEAKQKSGFSIGYPGWGLIYHLLLCHLDRKRREVIIETGTNQGCTTIVLAQALKDAGCDGEVVSFELEPENIATARTNLEAAGVTDRVRIVQGDSREKVPEFMAELSRNDTKLRVALLDASHLLDDVMAEFNAVLPRLADDALVIFDNTFNRFEPNEDQRVNGALKQIVKRHGGNLVNLEFVSWSTPGVAIWQRLPRL